jgi:hypothetical protein
MRRPTGAAGIVAASGLTAIMALAAPTGVSAATAPAGPVAALPTRMAVSAVATNADMIAVARMRVLFGHQSVGWNIMDGVAAQYRARRLSPPAVRDWSTALPVRSFYFAQAGIGQNGDPLSKITAFSSLVKRGAGARVNVAVMKFCFVDITAGTNVSTVFLRYRSTLAALHRAYPRVVFLHVTAPLTRGDVADNLVRQRFNALMRKEYGATGRLFDLAAIESTTPTGARVTGLVRGQRYYAMYAGYTSDGGHLNAVGSRRAADGFLGVIARAKP